MLSEENDLGAQGLVSTVVAETGANSLGESIGIAYDSPTLLYRLSEASVHYSQSREV
jgi:hypothetical protein